MVKKNREMTEATAVVCESLTENVYPSDEEVESVTSRDFEKFAVALSCISEHEDIIGYIIKNEVKAQISLKESANVIDLAMLSSQAFDSALELSCSFRLGEIGNIVIDGADLKVLCIKIGKNLLSIFMEKNVDHTDILNKIS